MCFRLQDSLAPVLLIVMLGHIYPAWSESEDSSVGPDDTDGVEQETIEILASPTQADGASVQVLSRDELESRGSASVDQALDLFSGVDVTSGRKGQRSISLRGFGQRQVAVFWDGVPLEIPYDGTFDLSLIPSELVQSIAVIKGAGSVIFGPNGMGGAINLRSRDLGSLPMLGLSLQAGQFDSIRTSVYHAKRYGPVDVLALGGLTQRSSFGMSSGFSPSINEDGGARENSSIDIKHTLDKVRWHLTEGHDIHAGLSLLDGHRDVEPDAFADPSRVRYWRFDPWRSLSASLGHSGRYSSGWHSDEVLYLGLYKNRLLSYDDASYSTRQLPRSFVSEHDDRVLGLRLRASGVILERDWVTSLSRSWLGAEYDTHQQTLDSQMDDTYSRSWLSTAQEFQFLFARRWFLSFALQADSEFAPERDGIDEAMDWALLPMASARFWVMSWLSVKLTAARRARFPTLKERYSSDGVFRLANPDLGAESAWHFALDLSANPWPFLRLSLGAFDAEVADLIENIPVVTQTGTAEQLVNIGRARMAGMELHLRYTPWKSLALVASYSYLYPRRLDTLTPNDRLEYRPSHKLVLQAFSDVGSWFHFWTGLRMQGPSDFINPDTMAWGRLGVFVVWDARVELGLPHGAKTWFMITNILDSTYQTQYGFPEPGRAVWLGLSLSYGNSGK